MFRSPFKIAVSLVLAFVVVGSLCAYFASADQPAKPATTVHVAVTPAPVKPCPNGKCCPNGDCSVRKIQVQKHVENRRGEIDYQKTIEVRNAVPNPPCNCNRTIEGNVTNPQPPGDCDNGTCGDCCSGRRGLFGRRW
jgi:hypothetical protein